MKIVGRRLCRRNKRQRGHTVSAKPTSSAATGLTYEHMQHLKLFLCI